MPMLAGATAASAAIHLLPEPARALDLDSDGGLITETVASRDRLRTYDNSKKYGAERIADRDRKESQPDGIRAGNYMIFPTIGTAVVYDDNIFATNQDKVSDFRTELAPRLRFQSQLPRHVLDLSLGGKIVNYLAATDQDYANVNANVDGALHFDHAHTLSVNALAALEHEERNDVESPRDAREPVAIRHTRVISGFTRDVGRLYGTVSAGFEQWDYDDTISGSGAKLDQDSRDLDMLSTQLKLGYRFSPGYELVGRIRALRQWNRGDGTTDYDGIGYEAIAGVAFETNPILRWRLLGGYGIREYEQASIDSIASSLIEGNVQWLATQRMTITGTVSRAIDDRIGSETGGRVESLVRAQLDYELYHNLVLTLGGEVKAADFIGVSREDRSWSAKIGLDYYHTKNWLFTFGYEHLSRDSSDDEFDVTRNRFTIGAKLRF
ncbi:MAG: hypothetical protein CTY20_04855 [Hyphomicrobium sp.]|nr:MAG: hypothetical protein CTY20_04855 [Hyphomicrobium sp.]